MSALPTKPTISIVIPAFRAAAHLPGALAAISRQAYPDKEVIVVDGGSNDGTVEFLESRPPGLTSWISESDSGIYDAINKGIARASGDLIVVLGCDDRFAADDALQLVAKAALTHPADLYAGQATFVHPDGSRTLRKDEPYGPGVLISGIPFCHNAMFATRSAYRDVGLYDTSYRICADANWVQRAVKKRLRCYRLPFVLVDFDMTGTSSTNPERIMDETYATIEATFPMLSRAESKALFAAARAWGPREPLRTVLRDHPEVAGLEEAVACVLHHLDNPCTSDGFEPREVPRAPTFTDPVVQGRWRRRLRDLFGFTGPMR